MAKIVRCSPDRVIIKLREAEVPLSPGDADQACKSLDISEQTYYTIWPLSVLGCRKAAPAALMVPAAQCQPAGLP